MKSFTWEKETNSRKSALIPAAFPRYLSQMAVVTEAGVDEVVSFTVQGIYDKPGSSMFIGQPGEANRFYTDYTDWLHGEGRWGLLGKTFLGDANHQGIANVTYVSAPSEKYNEGKLTDGRYGEELYTDKRWVGFENKDMEVVIDLGKSVEVKSIGARFMHYNIASIYLPFVTNFSISEDGVNYKLYSRSLIIHFIG